MTLIPSRTVYATLLVTCGIAHAALAENIPHYDCFQEASERYRIDVNLLVAIATVESEFDMSATNLNTNGTTDYGVMMINSHWEEKLAKMGIAWVEVTSSECLNIHVGAWVLASNFARSGVNWYAVGAYNAGFGQSDRTRKNRLRYASKVHRALTKIRARRSSSDRQETDSTNLNTAVASIQ